MSTGRASQDSHWTADDAVGQRKPKEDSLKRITWRIREITITIPNHQWIPISIRTSKLHCYRATMATDNRYEEVVDGAMNFQKREIAVSDQSRPTDKSKAHQETVYRDTHRQVYQEVDRQVCWDTHRQVYQEVQSTSQKYAERQVYQIDQDSTKAACRERNDEVDRMVTEADFERLLPNQDASTSQSRVPMTTGCTIYSTEHAEAPHRAQTALVCLKLVSITIFREAHLLDVNEWDETTWLTYTIDDHWRLRPISAADAPIDAKSWAEALPHSRIPTRTYAEIHEQRVRYWMAGCCISWEWR